MCFFLKHFSGKSKIVRCVVPKHISRNSLFPQKVFWKNTSHNLSLDCRFMFDCFFYILFIDPLHMCYTFSISVAQFDHIFLSFNYTFYRSLIVSLYIFYRCFILCLEITYILCIHSVQFAYNCPYMFVHCLQISDQLCTNM